MGGGKDCVSGNGDLNREREYILINAHVACHCH